MSWDVFINFHTYIYKESEKAEINISQQGSTSSSVTNSIGNANQTVLRGNEVALSPCVDYAEGLHAYFQAKPISFRRSSSISESYEEGFETDVSNLFYYIIGNICSI